MTTKASGSWSSVSRLPGAAMTCPLRSCRLRAPGWARSGQKSVRSFMNSGPDISIREPSRAVAFRGEWRLFTALFGASLRRRFRSSRPAGNLSPHLSFSDVVCTKCQKSTAQRKIWPYKRAARRTSPGSWRRPPSGPGNWLTCRGTRVIELLGCLVSGTSEVADSLPPIGDCRSHPVIHAEARRR